MRAVAVCVALGLFSASVHGAPPPKRTTPAPSKTPSKPPAATETGADPDLLDSPYGAESKDGQRPAPPPAAAQPASGPSPTAPPTAPKVQGAPASGDAKLDAPPTAPASGERPALSPLNPEANEFPSRKRAPTAATVDALLGDIATLRARVSALTTSLFSSKLRVVVRTEGDDARVNAFVVTLDGGVVFQASGQFVAEDERVVYEHAVAPGNHVLGVEVERHDVRGKAYRTWQNTRLSILVPDRKTLDVDVLVGDDSDMAEDFPEDEDGEYDLAVQVRARATE
jgi:hypothetical protein